MIDYKAAPAIPDFPPKARPHMTLEATQRTYVAATIMARLCQLNPPSTFSEDAWVEQVRTLAKNAVKMTDELLAQLSIPK